MGLSERDRTTPLTDNGANAVEFGAEEKVVVGDFVPFDGGGKKRFEGHRRLSKYAAPKQSTAMIRKAMNGTSLPPTA
jgi:hypothetical protein